MASPSEETCLQRFIGWMRKVFVRRKPYVLGDSCRSYWQNTLQVEKWYLIYRVVHCFVCFGVIVISFTRPAVYDEKTYKKVCEEGKQRKFIYCFMETELGIHINFTWPFYLTRWGLMGNFAQSVWALVLVAKAYVKQSKVDQGSALVTHQGQPGFKFHRSREEHGFFTATGGYWAVHSVFLCLATLISSIYWSVLHAVQPKGQPLSIIVALAEHAFNFIIMVVDYALVAYPVTATQANGYLFLFIAYPLCNYLYWACGGIDQEFKFHYLYPFLDWKDKPGLAVGSIFAIGLVHFLLHCLLLFVDHFKFKIKKKYIKRAPQSRSPTPENSEQSV